MKSKKCKKCRMSMHSVSKYSNFISYRLYINTKSYDIRTHLEDIFMLFDD